MSKSTICPTRSLRRICGEIPPAAETQDVPWASLDPVVNTSDTPGYLLAPGYLLDEHAGGYAGFSFNVATYPLLNELLSYDWGRVKEMAYAVFPELAATDALRAGPTALNEIAPGLYEAFMKRLLLPCEALRYMAFQFPIVAAATTMTRDEFVDHVVAESLRLRTAILRGRGGGTRTAGHRGGRDDLATTLPRLARGGRDSATGRRDAAGARESHAAELDGHALGRHPHRSGRQRRALQRRPGRLLRPDPPMVRT